MPKYRRNHVVPALGPNVCPYHPFAPPPPPSIPLPLPPPALMTRQLCLRLVRPYSVLIIFHPAALNILLTLLPLVCRPICSSVCSKFSLGGDIHTFLILASLISRLCRCPSSPFPTARPFHIQTSAVYGLSLIHI